MSEYAYMEDEDGYEIECASCNSDAPLQIFNRGFPVRKEEYICELCASTYIGNATQYPSQYVNVEMFQALAQVGNIVLDKTTNRRDGIVRKVAK